MEFVLLNEARIFSNEDVDLGTKYIAILNHHASVKTKGVGRLLKDISIHISGS